MELTSNQCLHESNLVGIRLVESVLMEFQLSKKVKLYSIANDKILQDNQQVIGVDRPLSLVLLDVNVGALGGLLS